MCTSDRMVREGLLEGVAFGAEISKEKLGPEHSRVKEQ